MIPSVPIFSITLAHVDADEHGPAADFVVIDAKDSEDVSSGFIVLDHPSYLLKLRAAIDGFISRHNIQPSNPCDNED